jgi:hypothetical protein
MKDRYVPTGRFCRFEELPKGYVFYDDDGCLLKKSGDHQVRDCFSKRRQSGVSSGKACGLVWNLDWKRKGVK